VRLRCHCQNRTKRHRFSSSTIASLRLSRYEIQWELLLIAFLLRTARSGNPYHLNHLDCCIISSRHSPAALQTVLHPERIYSAREMLLHGHHLCWKSGMRSSIHLVMGSTSTARLLMSCCEIVSSITGTTPSQSRMPLRESSMGSSKISRRIRHKIGHFAAMSMGKM
jgi:hypothetical protein